MHDNTKYKRRKILDHFCKKVSGSCACFHLRLISLSIFCVPFKIFGRKNRFKFSQFDEYICYLQNAMFIKVSELRMTESKMQTGIDYHLPWNASSNDYNSYSNLTNLTYVVFRHCKNNLRYVIHCTFKQFARTIHQNQNLSPRTVQGI